GLVEPPHQLTGRREHDAELLVLRHEPSGAEPELEAPVRDVIDGHRLVGEEARMAERVGADQHADADARRVRGESREDGPPFVVRSGGPAGLVEVIATPGAVEAETLEVPPPLDERGEGEILVRAEPEAHPAGHPDLRSEGD